jgi:hypothetical protein
MSVRGAELLSDGFLGSAGGEIDNQPTTSMQNKSQYPPLTSQRAIHTTTILWCKNLSLDRVSSV